MFAKNRTYLVAVALLFLGQSLFAGGGSGSGPGPPGPRGSNRPGFVAPVLHVAARAMEGFVARQEEDVITEGIHTGEGKMEEPEADQSEASGGDEGAFALEDLPPEVIVYYLIPHLGDRELGRLALTSHWAAELVREELKKRYTCHRIREQVQRASSLNYIARSQAAQEMGELLASSETQLTYEQVVVLLSILTGGIGHVGLAGDGNHWVRCRTAETIGLVLASRDLGEELRLRLLSVLIGNGMHPGLAGDESYWVRQGTTEAIGLAVPSRECSEEERSKLLDALIGNDTHRGLAGDGHYWVRVGVAQSTNAILASGKCGEDVRTRLLNALIGNNMHRGLAGDADPNTRWHAAKAIGVILASLKCGRDERSRLLKMLDRLAEDPYCEVRIKAREAIRLAREAQATSESVE